MSLGERVAGAAIGSLVGGVVCTLVLGPINGPAATALGVKWGAVLGGFGDGDSGGAGGDFGAGGF